jgi:SMC interacting uncharacterized protein involved in chromosome segregation
MYMYGKRREYEDCEEEITKLKDVIKDIQWIIERGRMCREDLQMIVEEVYKITKELERWGSLDT